MRCAIKTLVIARPASLAPVQAPAALCHQNAKHPLHVHHADIQSHLLARTTRATPQTVNDIFLCSKDAVQSESELCENFDEYGSKMSYDPHSITILTLHKPERCLLELAAQYLDEG